MPILLRTRHDLSVNEVMRLGRNHYVKVTPHVGNWTPARLVLPTLGISILCVDHTIGAKDRNAHPHLLIHEGQAHVLSDDAHRLTTHARVTRKANSGKHPLGTSVSDVHVGTLRALYPDANIVTHSEHLRAHREVTLAVLEEVTNYSLSAAWWRRVDGDGVVTNYRSRNLPRKWREYEHEIFSITNEQEGWLVHNRIAILMDVILQSQMGEEPEIYHLSGPYNVRYLGGEMERISQMYDRVRTRLGLRQETIIFNLIPFASFRFATRMAQASACEALCLELLRGDPEVRRVRECAQAAYDIFAESETEDYFTQHDCLSTGERIVVPEAAREWSMSTAAAHLAFVRSLM